MSHGNGSVFPWQWLHAGWIICSRQDRVWRECVSQGVSLVLSSDGGAAGLEVSKSDVRHQHRGFFISFWCSGAPSFILQPHKSCKHRKYNSSYLIRVRKSPVNVSEKADFLCPSRSLQLYYVMQCRFRQHKQSDPKDICSWAWLK